MLALVTHLAAPMQWLEDHDAVEPLGQGLALSSRQQQQQGEGQKQQGEQGQGQQGQGLKQQGQGWLPQEGQDLGHGASARSAQQGGEQGQGRESLGGQKQELGLGLKGQKQGQHGEELGLGLLKMGQHCPSPASVTDDSNSGGQSMAAWLWAGEDAVPIGPPTRREWLLSRL